jgi:hypothetical protein
MPFYAALRMRSIDTAVPIAVAFMVVHLLRLREQEGGRYLITQEASI